MDQELYDWILLLLRWLHITTAATWIGTSIFFMWLDRSFEPNPEATRPGHLGELWMVHGGGFYRVEKLQMGPTKVPERLHWFKWESYWTWISGFLLLALIFYSGDGAFLMDPSVSDMSFFEGILISLFSIFGSWFFYDMLWETKLSKDHPGVGHFLTATWLVGMTYMLCHTLSGRAAYMHVGAMLGTWMAANVFMRIIPRQVKMVAAAEKGESVNPDWAKNAKNRSTHNTYITLPVIFIMLSNHFPATYGHPKNWILLLGLCAAGAAIRQYFVIRLKSPGRAKAFAVVGLGLLVATVVGSKDASLPTSEVAAVPAVEAGDVPVAETSAESAPVAAETPAVEAAPAVLFSLRGMIKAEGNIPANRKLNLPQGCVAQRGEAHSNEVLVKKGRLQNVLVRITRGHEKLPVGAVPKQAVEVDQRGCLYVPRVIAARVGQEVVFINSDPIFHNVRSVGQKNANFNLSMPQKDQRISKVFTQPEIFFETRCSVHPWMSAFIAVMDHPYYALSDENGAFEIKNLAPGPYRVEFWHEVYGSQTRDFVVGEKEPEALTISFKK